MVSHHRLVHPVTRQSRGIVRARGAQPPSIFTRIRVLTPAEINQRLLENWNFIQIETIQQTQYNPPPLILPPRHFHGAGSPTLDIIEQPIIQEDSISPNAIEFSNLINPHSNQATVINETSDPVPSTSHDFYEDLHEQETIPFINDVSFADLVNAEDFGDLYDPVTEESQEQPHDTPDQSLSQLLEELLNDTNHSLDSL